MANPPNQLHIGLTENHRTNTNKRTSAKE